MEAPQSPRRVNLTFSIDPAQADRLDEYAHAHKRSRSALIAECVEAHLAALGEAMA